LAPAANLIFMSCDQKVNQGIITSEMALIDNNLSDTMSLSYGNSELNFTSSNYTTLDTLYAQAAAQGSHSWFRRATPAPMSRTRTQPDSHLRSQRKCICEQSECDGGWGTDFVDTYDSVMEVLPKHLLGATNTATFGDALDTCLKQHGTIVARAVSLQLTRAIPEQPLQRGQRLCERDVVGVQAASAPTMPCLPISRHHRYSGTMRAQPDISAFASNGFWSHALVSCDSHVASTACDSTLTTFAASGAHRM